MAISVLGPLRVNGPIEKRGCKQGMFRFGGSHYVKIVFALLTKVIAVYI